MTKCPLCGAEAVRKFTLPHTSAWECKADDCGLRFASPQLGEPELARAYSTHYYPTATNDHTGGYEQTPAAVVGQLLSQLETAMGGLQGSRMLDYGCGRGPISAVAPEFGVIPTGIEPDRVARSAAAEQLRMPVYANLDELPCQGGRPQFDVILLWQVIEHLRLPWQDLRLLHPLLSANGKLLIGTMNANCLRARVERSRWTHYLNPTHFYYFDRKSLERILSHSGFSQVTEWKPKFHYPQHGLIRGCTYQVASVFGVADGLYYLCSA